MNDYPPTIRMENVGVMRGGVTIVKDVNWELPAGKCMALLGPNGSGKTTLTRVITGFMWPTWGTVEVLGETFGRTDMRLLRQRIAIVDPSERFGVDRSMSARDVVLTGYFASLWLYETATDDQRDQASALLDAVGLGHRKDHEFRLLSTGEQRRALLARALIQRPELLILDEPTAGLDLPGREHLLATLKSLCESPDTPSVILVTHHVEEIGPYTDQVLLMKEGRVAAAGPPDQVITPETLSDVFGCKVWVQKRSGRFWLEVLPEAWVDLLKQSP